MLLQAEGVFVTNEIEESVVGRIERNGHVDTFGALVSALWFLSKASG
jgi:hypothetical protein